MAIKTLIIVNKNSGNFREWEKIEEYLFNQHFPYEHGITANPEEAADLIGKKTKNL